MKDVLEAIEYMKSQAKTEEKRESTAYKSLVSLEEDMREVGHPRSLEAQCALFALSATLMR